MFQRFCPIIGTQHMTAANAVEAGIPTVWNGYMLTEDIAAPTLTRYSVERRFSQPEVTAWDQYGACAVHKDENEVYVVERNYDARLQAEATERVEKVVNTFSKFVADDTSRENMLDYVRKGTNAYSIIQTFDNNWFGRHSGAVVTNLEIGDFIRFSEDTMACRIHYDFVVSSGDNSATYDTNYWFYFVYRNDQWYLYDFYAIL